ncbi:MAG: hypothetical protein N2511_05755 [Thermodesulfovibrionales bacterium]|nr:hypothetical protein [Thermodesulfovibrionales bacterium]
MAEDLGLSVSGTIRVLLKAERLGIIKSALQKIYELREKGFHDKIGRHIMSAVKIIF